MVFQASQEKHHTNLGHPLNLGRPDPGGSTLTAHKAPHGLGVTMAAPPEWPEVVGGVGHLYEMDPRADGSWGLGGWAGI